MEGAKALPGGGVRKGGDHLNAWNIHLRVSWTRTPVYKGSYASPRGLDENSHANAPGQQLRRVGGGGDAMDVRLVVVGDVEHAEEVLPLVDVVGLDAGAEDGEAPLLLSAQPLSPVLVGAGDLNVLPRPCPVDQVGREDDFLVPRHTTGGHRPGRLLQNNFLVVPRRGEGERKGGRERRKEKERAFEDA